MIKSFFILFFVLGLAFIGKSQDSISVISGSLLEDIIENNDEQSYDFYSLYDELKVFLDDPINLNNAVEDDLRGLGLLNDIQIEDIIDHRHIYGDFLSPYELQSIPSMDMGTLNAVIPFVGVGNQDRKVNLGSLIANSTHNIVGKYKRIIQEKKGFTDQATSPYLGNADHYYLRYNLTSGRNLRVGLTMEKDPGEEFFKGINRNGFDYYSGFVYLRDVHPIFKDVVLGDYSISMGQGLILHNSFGSSKSGYVMNVKKGGRVIKPYSSVNEFNLLRGFATTMLLSDYMSLTTFASSKNIDANTILNDTIIDAGFERFSSFVTNGLHRTENEISKKGALNQKSAGGVVKLKLYDKLRIGVNMLYNKFNTVLTPRNDIYRKFSFTGDQLTNLSIDYSYRFQNFNFFGELARSDNGGKGQLHGLLVSMSRNFDATVIYRNYAKDYHVLNGNAFGETAQPINEKGIYFGLQFRPYQEITVSSYFDIWSHPWLRSRADAPSKGREFLTKIEYNKRRKFNLYLQYRFEQKSENSSIATVGLAPLANRSQHRVRLNFTYSYSKELSLTNRVEYNHFEKDNQASQGFLAFQDIKYKPIEKPYSIAIRYSLFDTDDFNSRIYTYENDVLYEFSIPFYNYSGSRFYVKAQYRLNRKLYFQLRYARTHINNVEDILLSDGTYVPLSIGSGNERTLGSVRSDVKFVVKYKIR